MRGDDPLHRDGIARRITNALLRPVAHFLVAAFLMWLLYRVMGAQGHLLYMWPITGIQIAILLSGPPGRIQRSSQIIAGAVGMSLASFALGNPPWRALAQPAMHAVELWALGWAMSKQISRFDDLKNQANVIRFCSSAILVPVFAALLIAQPLAAMAHASFLQAWTRVVLSDSLGIGIFTPAVLLALSGQFANRGTSQPLRARRDPGIALLCCCGGPHFLRPQISLDVSRFFLHCSFLYSLPAWRAECVLRRSPALLPSWQQLTVSVPSGGSPTLRMNTTF